MGRCGFFRSGGHRQFAIPLGKFEDRADRVFALVGLQRDVPEEVGSFRIDLVEAGQCIHVAIDAHFAEAAEVAQQQGGVVALRIELEARLEADFKGLVATEVVEREGDRLETAVVGRLGCGGGNRCRCWRFATEPKAMAPRRLPALPVP
jgi:hypothetical protein